MNIRGAIALLSKGFYMRLQKDPLTARIYSLVHRNPLFTGLSPKDLQNIINAGYARKFIKGEMIAFVGDMWPFLFLILEGKVSAWKESSGGRRLIIAEFEPGDVFWGLAFFHEGLAMPVSLEIRLNALIYLWNREQLLPFLKGNGNFCWEFSRLLVKQMLRASEIVEGLAFQPVAGRVARFLLEQTGREPSPTSRNITLDEIAARIGTTREMVCRCLQNFSDNKLIEITRTEYTISDRAGLESLTRQVKG